MTALRRDSHHEASSGERGRGLLAGPGGYEPFNRWSEGFYSLSNQLLSLAFLILLAPLFLVLAVVLKIVYRGGPIIYRGVRLGRKKQPFVMYKFRTLPLDAQRVIGDSLLSSRHQMTTPLTEFLRSTRLDELPQLFNVLKRDMDFIGPRPERPEIYEKLCRHLKGYDLRFRVRPGLVGYSQLFTPHSAPKRLRVLIDNKYVCKPRNIFWDIAVVGFTGVTLLKTFGLRLGKELLTLAQSRGYRRYRERRRAERIRPKEARVFLREAQGGVLLGPILNINDSCLKLLCSRELPDDDLPLRLEILIDKGARHYPKKALCTGRVFRRHRLESPVGASIYLIDYVPVSPLNHYIVDQYILKKSIA
jgi:lipopolysaccharide/colanic/teichoic acid biosynthesis glycosyltransferase